MCIDYDYENIHVNNCVLVNDEGEVSGSDGGLLKIELRRRVEGLQWSMGKVKVRCTTDPCRVSPSWEEVEVVIDDSMQPAPRHRPRHCPWRQKK